MSASAGRVLLMPKGVYDAATTYTMLDMVRYGKSTFVCKQTSTGNTPDPNGDTAYWQLIATSGDVSGVKGNAEADYREGNVNLTPANLGIYPFTASTLPIGGLVPVSNIGDEGKYLKGDGSWNNTGVHVVTTTSVSALPVTITDSAVNSNMVVVDSYLSNPAAQTGEWTVTTSSGSVTVSGTISGTTDISITLSDTY
jgi:hypothetical protein